MLITHSTTIINVVSLILLILGHSTSVHGRNAALCFLTYRPSSELLEFAQELVQDAVDYNVEIFIMIDDNNLTVTDMNITSNLQLLQLSNKTCIEHNYRNTISLGGGWREVTAWDKTLLYFSILHTNYSFVWLIEEDIFIPSVQAFRSLHELYSSTADLIVPRNGLNLLGDSTYWLWSMASGQFIPPWSCSMVNIVGLSRRMLIAIDDYVQWLGEVPFHEYFFNTLAIQLNLTIFTPTELSTDIFSTNYNFEDIRKRPNNLWHPIKDFSIQKQWRKRLANETLINNHTIELNNLEMLCHNNSNMTDIEQYLKNLLIEFEVHKSEFSPSNRHLLRQRFTHLVQQCKYQNASKEIISLGMTLADHAYKLPEPRIEPLVTNKSEHHLKLEQALKENKESIRRLAFNSSALIELRTQRDGLIKKLTSEIQREYKEQNLLREQTTLSSTLLLSFSSTTNSTEITTAITSDLLSSTQVTIVKVHRIFHQLVIPDDKETLNIVKNDVLILFLISIGFCIIFMLLKWKTVECTKSFIIIVILLLLLIIDISYNMKSI